MLCYALLNTINNTVVHYIMLQKYNNCCQNKYLFKLNMDIPRNDKVIPRI